MESLELIKERHRVHRQDKDFQVYSVLNESGVTNDC